MGLINLPVSKRAGSSRPGASVGPLDAPWAVETGSGPVLHDLSACMLRPKLKGVFALGLQQLFGFSPPGIEVELGSSKLAALLRHLRELEEVIQIVRPPRKCTVFEGMMRACDRRILDLLEKALLEHSGPLRVLEIAAGRSFPYADCYGSPWLARLIKQKFGDQVNVLVSDSCDSKLSGFCRRIELTQSGTFRIHPAFDLGRPEFEALREELIDHIDDEFLGPRFCRLDRRWMEAAEKTARASGTPPLFPNKDSHWFVRPALDPVFERVIFGIEAVGLAPLELAPRIFAGRTFDFIFGRHLEPWHRESKQLFEGLPLLLSENAKGLIHIGGFRRNPDTYISFDRAGFKSESA